jgi:hypothetical protein
MELRDYLHKNRMKVADFCRLIDYSGPYMYRVVNQQRPAGRRLALIIEKATNGECTYKELTNPEHWMKEESNAA